MALSVAAYASRPAPARAQGGELASAQARTAQYVFVIDDSGSMSKRIAGTAAADPDRLSVFAVRSLLSMLDDADEATVVRLNGPDTGEAITPIAPLSENRQRLNTMLDLNSTLAEYGGKQTPCASALDAVQRELNRAKRTHVAQVVFFLTDGECSGELPSTQRWLSGVQTHAEGLLKFYLLRFRGRQYTRTLETMASATEGAASLVSADDPTSILKPFASALSRSQGYEAYLLSPRDQELDAHRGARRVRLLAVAPDRGQPLSFKISPTRTGEAPVATGPARGGVHQYADGRRFRFAALDYRPGTVPVSVGVDGAGNDWKIVAVPEYRLFVDVSVSQGRCGEAGEEVQFVEVGSNACVTVSLINETGQVVTADIAGRGTDAEVRYTAPGQDQPSKLPANRLGDEARFTLERANLERGDHVFRPTMRLSLPGSPNTKITLRGAARTLQVSSRRVLPVPARFELGEMVPGKELYNELTLKGNFPSSRGRMVVEGRKDVPECVTFELSGKPEGEAQPITPGQKYTLAVRVAPYCGHASFTREIDTALRIEFDKAAASRAIPSVVIPVKMTLVNQLQLPDEIVAEIDGGKSTDVAVKLSGNHIKDVAFKALMPAPGDRPKWPKGKDLDLVFLDEGGDTIRDRGIGGPARALPIVFGQGAAKPMMLRFRSGYCCAGGTYDTELALVPEAGSKEVIRVPVRVVVREAGVWSCYGSMILWGLFALLMLLLILYVFNMFRQSNFLRRDLMSSKLVPLRWDEWGEPVAMTRQQDDVKRMIARGMPVWSRALNWLKANPLRFGLPGQAYYETVQLYLEPARDVNRSRVVLLPERDLYQRLRQRPGEGSGRIYATARGGMLVFAVPDREGRLGRLQFQDDMGGFGDMGWGDEAEPEYEVMRLRRDELLNINSDREPDTAAGWRVG